MVLGVLAQALDLAVDHGLLIANPARGSRRKAKAVKPRRTFLEADMVRDLLDAAGAWEAELPKHQRYGRRALLALLCLAGPRIGEAIRADRGDFDLPHSRWRIPESKTDAGRRRVELSAFLTDELRTHADAMKKLERPIGPKTPMFPTATGGRLSDSNIRTRLLVRAVEKAQAARGPDAMSFPPINPHGLRRTYASLALAAGQDPRFVMAQLGHTDARLTMSVYAQIIQRRSEDRALIWQLMRFADEPKRPPRARSFDPRNGTLSAGSSSGSHSSRSKRQPKTAPYARFPVDGRYWARTSDLQLVELALSQLS